ncbi:MAG: helix-turn-helix domain-containing protein [Mycobacterium sp.]
MPKPPLPTIKANTRIMGDVRTQLRDRVAKQYERGASIRALAEQTGRSYGFIHRLLGESGVTLRGRGGRTRVGA